MEKTKEIVVDDELRKMINEIKKIRNDHYLRVFNNQARVDDLSDEFIIWDTMRKFIEIRDHVLGR